MSKALCNRERQRRALLRRADDANELREFCWSEVDVVLRVEQQSIAVKLEVQNRVVGSFRKDNFYGESVFRAPCACRGNHGICRHAEGVIESVSKHAATVGPRLSSDRHSCFAERHFRAALALELRDDYLLAAYADFLLEQGRAAEVGALLKKWGPSDNLLLRRALAAKLQKLPEAQKYAQAVGERFAEAALRGERLHLGEEARYLLDLKGDAKGALAAARENWKTQREPRDAGMLLEAALAAGERKAAAPALRWLEESGFEDARLRRLAARLK